MSTPIVTHCICGHAYGNHAGLVGRCMVMEWGRQCMCIRARTSTAAEAEFDSMSRRLMALYQWPLENEWVN